MTDNRKRKGDELKLIDTKKKKENNIKYKVELSYKEGHFSQDNITTVGTFDTLDECRSYVFTHYDKFINDVRGKSDCLEYGTLPRNKSFCTYNIFLLINFDYYHIEEITINNKKKKLKYNL